MKSTFILIVVTIGSTVPAWTNILPGPSILNQIVLCGSGTPSCQTLAQSTGAPISFPSPGSLTIPQITLNGSVSEDLPTGSIRAFSSYAVAALPSAFTQMNSGAQISDIVTVSSPKWNGKKGTFTPVYALSGTVSPAGRGQISFGFENSVGTTPLAVQNGPFVAGNAVVSFSPLSFDFGQPFLLYTSFGADVFIGGGGQLSGFADYSHTATLQGLQVFDPTGNIVTDATFTSQLGVPIVSAVPEPASLLLFASALVALFAFRYSRSFT